MNSGAAQSAMVSLDRDYLHGQMRNLLKKKSVLSLCANPIEALRAFSEATEMATRLAEFDLAKKGYTGVRNRLFGKERSPLSNVEAGIEARDVTLDFGRHGKSTQSLNQTIAFFNAAIQGTDKMVREFKEHPGQMLTKTFIGITLPSLVLWYLNKDDPRYQELPQWQKDIFWVIPGNDTLYKIPKPFELRSRDRTGADAAVHVRQRERKEWARFQRPWRFHYGQPASKCHPYGASPGH